MERVAREDIATVVRVEDMATVVRVEDMATAARDPRVVTTTNLSQSLNQLPSLSTIGKVMGTTDCRKVDTTTTGFTAILNHIHPNP
jgi:hypothetical protein